MKDLIDRRNDVDGVSQDKEEDREAQLEEEQIKEAQLQEEQPEKEQLEKEQIKML